jgi:hypothetical protein
MPKSWLRADTLFGNEWRILEMDGYLVAEFPIDAVFANEPIGQAFFSPPSLPG